MGSLLITNGRIVNEGNIVESDILIRDQRIEKIANRISASETDQIIDAAGKYIFPGVIDDQVHPIIVQEILGEAGCAVGIGDYRPRYGRFDIIEFEVQSEED